MECTPGVRPASFRTDVKEAVAMFALYASAEDFFRNDTSARSVMSVAQPLLDDRISGHLPGSSLVSSRELAE